MAASAPVTVTVPGSSSSPTAPATVEPASGSSNKFGGAKKYFLATGFTSDATSLNATWEPVEPTGADVQYEMEGSSGDNYLGYVTDRWIIYAEFGVTTGEQKAELVTTDTSTPVGEYTGLNDQAGDTVTIAGVPPVPITV